MKFLTEGAVLVCAHEAGIVQNEPSQSWATINKKRILVEPDPVGRKIVGCPNVGPAIKPCAVTLVVKEGYSSFIRIGGRRVCLDTVTGLTDGTPPGTVRYKVRSAGQEFVSE